MTTFRNMLIGNQMRQIEHPFLTFYVIAETGADVFNLRIFGAGTNVYWGDGTVSFCGGDTPDVSHTFAPGTYTVSIERSAYVYGFSVLGATCNIVESNEAWMALPNMTSLQFYSCVNSQLEIKSLPESVRETSWKYAFQGSSNALLPLRKLPSNIVESLCMFDSCTSATLPFEELPKTLRGNCRSTFFDCRDAVFKITYIPDAVVDMTGFAYRCAKASITLDRLPAAAESIEAAFFETGLVANLDEIAANAPEGGYIALTTFKSAFTNCQGVTGSRSAFLAACPNIQMSDSDIAFAFANTSTTA